eukprot:4011444-Ditylum_brightwellii.AAC.1
MTERSKQNKYLVCDEDNDVDDGDNDSVDNGGDDGDDDGVDDGVDDGAEGADKYLTHLSQAADFCLTKRSKQNKHLVCDDVDIVDDGVDNGDNDSVDDGDDD